MADILASDINGIRTKVVNILGNGAGSKGYGQTVYSNSVTAGQVIEKGQWDALRFDIYNCILHQTGNDSPPLTDIPLNAVITDDAGDALKNYDYYSDVITNNRFDIAVGQFGSTPKVSDDTSSTWSSSATTELTVTWTDADDARHFFNSGGKIRITTNFTPNALSPTQQSNAWKNLIDEVIIDFSARPENPINYYSLTNSFQTYSQKSSSTPYSANYYGLKAKVDVPDNSLGTATVLTISLELIDNYVDLGAPAPGDLVDGKLEIFVSEIKGTTVLSPFNTAWDITSPTYSLASITLT